MFPLIASLEEDARGGVFHANDNSFTITSTQLDDLQNRRYYINIHSSRAPSGEIRGQIVSGRARGVFRAALAGANEIPRVMTEASGMVIAEVMNDSVIHVSGSFSNLEGDLAIDLSGGSHLHNGMPGTNREVLIPLNVTVIDGSNYVYPYNDNQFTLTNNDIPRLYNRGVYVNIHSSQFPGGEIRGQLLPESHIVFDAYLSSVFADPEVNSNAIGKVKATLRGNVLQLNGSFAGLTGTFASQIGGGAHIHMGLAGSTGSVTFPLTTTIDADSISGRFRPQDNRFELDSAQIVVLRNRGFYVNIHSNHNLMGEIRGQFLHEANLYFAAPLSGASASLPVKSGGSGMIVFEVAGNRIVGSGSVRNILSGINTSIAGGAHIHLGMAGRYGGIILSLTLTQPVDSTGGRLIPGQNNWVVSDGWIDTLRSRAYYVNIHSNAIGSGEVRGQVLPFSNAYYSAFLSGINQPDPVPSTSSGHLKFELNGRNLTTTGTYNNLSTPLNADIGGGAHIHQGGPAMGGGVVLPLFVTVSEDSLSGRLLAGSNSVSIDSMEWELLRSGRLYVNIHSEQNPGGELRGQILREINDFPTSSRVLSPEDSMIVEIDPNTDLPFTVSWSPSNDRDPVVYLWQLAIDSGFTSIIFTVPAGPQTQLLFDNDSLSTTLQNLGVALGDSVTIYHRIIALDGSLHSIGEVASATLVNGTVTSTIIWPDRNISLDLFPNPAQEQLNIRLSHPLEKDTNLYLLNINGQVLHSDLISRGITQKEIGLGTISPGAYLLKIGNQAIPWFKG